MFYAHVGDSSDNAFTTYNGTPVRTFAAFATKADRAQFVEETWCESGTLRNVIPCSRKFVEKWLGRDFVVTPQGVISRQAYDSHY